MPLMAHDVQYSFDGAVELQYLTADVAAFFRYFHPDPNGWHDSQGNDRGWDRNASGEIVWTRRFEENATTEYLRARPNLSLRQRTVCSYEGLLTLAQTAQEMARNVVGEMLSVVPDGGLTHRVVRRLMSPAAMRRAAKRYPHHEQHRTAGKALMARARADSIAMASQGAGLEREHAQICSWIDAERRRLREHEADIMARAREMISQPICSSDEYRTAYNTAIAEANGECRRLDIIRRRHRLEQRKRKVARRGIALLSSLTSYETARMFIGGNVVEIHGREYVFRLKKNHGATSLGQAGLEIVLADHAGAVLANLCLYFEDTPAIDQVAAIAMHVAAGEEHDLIKTGNLYRVQEAAKAHSGLMALKYPNGLPAPLAPYPVGENVSPLFVQERDYEERARIRKIAVPICERIVLELINPRLVHMGEAHRRNQQAALVAA